MNKKTKILTKIFGFLFIILLIMASFGLSYTILLYESVENFYRLMFAIVIWYITLFIIYGLISSIKKSSLRRFIISIILSLIFFCIFIVLTFLIYTVYSKINKFNKTTIDYTTVLITFNEKYKKLEDINDSKIGLIDEEDNYEIYILPMEVINENKLDETNEIIKYSSSLELISALYNGEVDLVFINSNYVELFESLEEYSDIESKAYEVYKYSKEYDKSKVENEEKTSSKKLTEPFTILLLGVDSKADGLKKNAAFNGDTLMLISFNPNTLQATMFSIPRDTYVPITCSKNILKKINTSAYGGTRCVINTVEKFTGIDIDYYVKINFKGVTGLVDSLGGITVNVPMDFCEQNSDRKFGNNLICLKKGVRKLNGEETLALARHRKTLTSGDFQRGQNQQLIVWAMLNQIKTVKSVSTVYEILDNISKNIDTNLTTDQMLSFYDVIKSLIFSSDNNILNIQKTYLRGYGRMIYEPTAKGMRYVFFNWEGSLNDIVNAMKVNLGLKKSELVKKFAFSINDKYEQHVIGNKTYSETKVTLLPNFKTYSIADAIKYINSKGLDVYVKDYSSKEDVSTYDGYTIVGQKEPPYYLIKILDSVTIYVSKTTTPSDEEEIIEEPGEEVEEIPEDVES